MNYMEQVAKMLGVETGERFRIGTDIRDYHMEQDGLWLDSCDMSGRVDSLLVKLLAGDFEIVKKPWRPKSMDTFYYVVATGYIHYYHYDKFSPLHRLLGRVGNCYRTVEEITPKVIRDWVDWYNGGKNPTEAAQ